MNSLVSGNNCVNVNGIDISTSINGDTIGTSIGVALGEHYLENLIKNENSKSKVINYHTYAICTYDDVMSGLAYESLSFMANYKLNKYILIVVLDEYLKDCDAEEVYTEDLINKFKELDFNIIDVNGNKVVEIDDAIDDAKNSKKPSVIIVNTKSKKDNIKIDYNAPLTTEALDSLRSKYKMDGAFQIKDEVYKEIKDYTTKRLGKWLTKWEDEKKNAVSNSKVKQVIEFLQTKDLKIDFNIDSLKINDNYEEELNKGTGKIFNILAVKSPFILSASNDNFIYSHCNIKKSLVMSKENPTERNINFGGRSLAMASICNGLASLGFKVFVSMPLIDSNVVRSFIRYSANNNLDVHYIFTNDNFLNTYLDNGISAVDEINSLRIIPNFITFRPADINEVIGSFHVMASSNVPSALVVSNYKLPKLVGTNPKYVVAGFYRVKRERGEANGVLIATGSEVQTALKLAEDLLQYGIDLRVVSAPSTELFERQSDRYKYMLLPRELKIFSLEFGSTSVWSKYVTSSEYALGLDNFSEPGIKNELLKHHKLDMDSLKTRIIELMKN